MNADSGIRCSASAGVMAYSVTPANSSMAFEKLHGPLVLFGLFQAGECSKIRRFPVLLSFLREYKRYSPDFNFRIISVLLCLCDCCYHWTLVQAAAFPLQPATMIPALFMSSAAGSPPAAADRAPPAPEFFRCRQYGWNR